MFQVYRIHENIYRIIMPFVSSLLIVGNEKALLVDTGFGYGDLKKVVESITDLPYEVVLSHGHGDHIGGSAQFGEVYLNEKDFELAKTHQKLSVRKAIWERQVPADKVDAENNLWQPDTGITYVPLTEEMIFDLGNITVQPFELPGHTSGSMIFIIEEIRYAIFGDSCGHPTLLTLEESTDVETFYHAMKKIKVYEGRFKRVLFHHKPYEVDKKVLDNNIELAEKILNGTDDKILIKFGNDIHYAATQHIRGSSRTSRLVGNIIY